MYKDFNSKFAVLCEEETTRWKGAGLMPGDYVKIRKDVLKSPKLAGRPSQFYDRIKEIMNSDLPLKCSAIKSMRPETQHGLFGGADAPAEFYVDIVQCANPGLFVNCMTLPLEVLDFVSPNENNFSPEHPDSWSYDNKVQMHPAAPQVTDKELLSHTQGDKRNMPTKDTKNPHAKEPKDGRNQATKPKKYKESVDMTDAELITEAYINEVEDMSQHPANLMQKRKNDEKLAKIAKHLNKKVEDLTNDEITEYNKKNS